VQFLLTDSYDYRHLAAALLVAAIGAFEKWYAESNPDIAAPTVSAVNATLQTALQNPVISVPPPKTRLPRRPVIEPPVGP
jgi:hypothetical protein